MNFVTRAKTKKNTLHLKILDLIGANGPISLSDFISLALLEPDLGYYQTRQPFGTRGDFITAPEISGLFGEMCGLYIANLSEIAGLDDAGILELGPGRGNLMEDMRHVWKQLDSDLAKAPVHFVEISPNLRKLQRNLFNGTDVYWHDNLDNLPPTPLFGIANEFFDALPIDQAVWRAHLTRDNSNLGRKRHGAWHHRLVGVIDGELEFVDGSVFDKDSLKKWKLEHSDSPRDGQILEDCPIAEKIAGQLARHLVSYGGAFLIIDYGKNDPQGDSLQAVAAHKPANIFLDPGSADLSHWVDFSVLRRAALDEGARFIGPITQGSFLSRIGIGSRAERAANASKKETRRELFSAVDRLVSAHHMGSAFKVSLILPPGRGLPPGFDENETDWRSML